MKTCVVTGSTSGIGRSLCIELYGKNIFNNIVLVGRRESDLLETVSQMKGKSPDSNVNIYPLVFDLENIDGIKDLIQKIVDLTGTIDALVNAAGYTEPAQLLDTTFENTLKTYTVNVFALMELIKNSVNYLKISKGKILNIASTAGITPRPGWISYSSSKAAVISISNTLSSELSEYGIKVYCISPGRCATPLRRKLAPDEDFSTIMQPQDVAKYMCYILSKEEMFLDGQNIVVRKAIL